MKNLLKNIVASRSSNSAVSATTSVNGAVVDMLGYDGCLFVMAIGATDGTPGLKIQQGKKSDGSDMADLVGVAVAYTATDDNKVALADVSQPRERYLRAVATRAGGTGTVLDGLFAIQYRASVAPTAQPTATVVGSLAVSAPPE